MLRSALIAITLALVLPATADAGWRTDRAKAIANAVWDRPCDGKWDVRWSDVPEGMPLESIAWASFDGCKHPGQGVVYIDRNAEVYTFEALCTYILHEVGHLAGHAHSDNPRSIMYPQSTIVEGRSRHHERWVWDGDGDRRCENRGRPFLERVRPLAVPRFHDAMPW